MADCESCKNYDRTTVCATCENGSDFEEVAMSNADRIRSMSDEELAEFLEQFEVCSHCEYSDKERCTFANLCVHEFATAIALKWLKSKAE